MSDEGRLEDCERRQTEADARIAEVKEKIAWLENRLEEVSGLHQIVTDLVANFDRMIATQNRILDRVYGPDRTS